MSLHTLYLLPAFLLLALQAYLGVIGFGLQLVILGISLVVIGIPHGALDYLVFRQQEHASGRHYPLLRFGVFYLGLMLLYGLLWWLSASLALIVFLLISAWHFADTDLAGLSLQRASDQFIRIAWGCWLLLSLLFTHTTEIIPYLQQLTGAGSLLVRFAHAYAGYSTAVWLGGLAVWPLLLWLRLRSARLPLSAWLPVVAVLLLLLLCRMLPLILAFTVYFSFWHSLRSFRSVCHYLAPRRLRSGWLRQWLLQTLPFIAGAFAGLALFFLFGYAPGATLSPFWIFLSLITLPHGLLMHDVFARAAPGQQEP